MIGRMILHGVAAAVVIGALSLGWQAYASPGGLAGASSAVARLVNHDGREHGRHDD